MKSKVGNMAFRAAIHEAGHALANLTANASPCIEGLWIKQTRDGWQGLCACNSRWQPGLVSAYDSMGDHIQLARKLAHRDCIEYLAGPVAEFRQAYRTRWMTQGHGYNLAKKIRQDFADGSDMAHVQIRLSWLAPVDLERAFVDLWLEAENLVALHWTRINGLARVLIANGGELSTDQIYEWWDSSLAR